MDQILEENTKTSSSARYSKKDLFSHSVIAAIGASSLVVAYVMASKLVEQRVAHDSLPTSIATYDLNRDGTLQPLELSSLLRDYDFRRKDSQKQR